MLSAEKMNLFVLVLCCACRNMVYSIWVPLLRHAFTIKDRMRENEKGKETDRRKKENISAQSVSDAGLGGYLRVLFSDSCVSYWICAAEIQWAAAFTFWLKGILFCTFQLLCLLLWQRGRKKESVRHWMRDVMLNVFPDITLMRRSDWYGAVLLCRF